MLLKAALSRLWSNSVTDVQSVYSSGARENRTLQRAHRSLEGFNGLIGARGKWNSLTRWIAVGLNDSQLSNILTAEGPNTMLRDRAVDVPTGAHTLKRDVRIPMRLRGEHVASPAYPPFNFRPEALWSTEAPLLRSAAANNLGPSLFRAIGASTSSSSADRRRFRR